MSNEMMPRPPQRPLRWTDTILDLPDLLNDITEPAYLVGGAVRDALLGRPVMDVDIATSGSGLALARLIANRLGGDFYPLDTERSVGRALVETPEGQVVFDVARLRGDLRADLLDRDFTMNAMAVDLRGDLSLLIDPLGGEQDTFNRVIRRCNPNSLQDDPIRTLRSVRQSVQFNARIEKETLADVRAAAPRLLDVSPERVRDEVFKLLSLPDATKALRAADALGLLKIIFPEVEPLRGLKQEPPHVFDAWTHTLAVVEQLIEVVATISPKRTDATAAQFSLGMIVMALDPYRKRLQAHLQQTWANDRSHRSLLLLAALLHDTGKAAPGDAPERGVSARITDTRARALRLSNAERQRLVTIVEYHALLPMLADLTPRSIYRFWRATGEAGIDVCLLALADHLGTLGPYFQQDAWIVLLERVRTLFHAYYVEHDRYLAPTALIDGTDLIAALHLRPGRMIGELLELIREARAAGEIETADEALALARANLERRNQ